MIYLDGHVHIYQEFPLVELFAAALGNLTRQRELIAPGEPASFLLLLTEGAGYNRFTELRRAVESGAGELSGGWRLEMTDEENSLRVIGRGGDAESCLHLVTGRQLITHERLEVLALACPAPLADGRSLVETVQQVRAVGGVAVLPWGVGKWLGRRGKMVESYLQSADPEGLFVGDNGGRPVFWPEPAPFAAAARRRIGLLSGSDPLPLPGEERRCGGFGTSLAGDCSGHTPAADLLTALVDGKGDLRPFGRRLGLGQFLRTRLALQRRKKELRPA
jgi:hypothetical protein